MKQDIKEVINHFVELLYKREIEACRTFIAEIIQYETMQHVCNYFDAILSDVVDHDWWKLQSVCLELLCNADVDKYLKGQAAISLGIAYIYQAKWSDALDAYTIANQIFETLDEPIERAKALKHIGIVHHTAYYQGDCDQEKLVLGCNACIEAVQISESAPPQTVDSALSLGMFIDNKADTWNSLGLLHSALGDFHDAEDAFSQALTYTVQTNNQFLRALIHDSLGETCYMAGQFEKAESQYLQALETLKEINQDTSYNALLHTANLAVLMRKTERCEEALSYFKQAIDMIEYIRSNNHIEVRAGFDATVAHTYANAVLTCIQADEKEQAFDYVQQARSRAFLDMISTGNMQHDIPTSAPTLSLAEVQSRLPNDVLLLEYFTTGLVESQKSREYENRPGFPDSRTFIFVVTASDIEICEVSMPPNDFLPGDLHGVIENHFFKTEIQQVLYRVLIQPILPWVKGKKTIYLVPHGPLHYVPFQAILAQEPQFWLMPDDAPQLIYTPSATILCSDLEQSDPSNSDQTNREKVAPCLAVGFDGDGGNSQDHVKGKDIQLGFAESEAYSIAHLTNGQALVGSDLKKKDFFALANDYRYLHISCHGYFNPEAPLSSALHFANDEYLTAQEVLDQLTLTCDLVILSACETGLSLVQRGDELFGLVRAFLSAGTKAMIVTQWRVDEGSTTILMEKFYRYLQQGLSYPDALRKARNELMAMTCAEAVQTLESYKELHQNVTQARQERMDLYIQRFSQQPHDKRIFADPYYWAPFILISQELE